MRSEERTPTDDCPRRRVFSSTLVPVVEFLSRDGRGTLREAPSSSASASKTMVNSRTRFKKLR